MLDQKKICENAGVCIVQGHPTTDSVPITRFEVSATARRKLELLAMPKQPLEIV